MSKIHDAAQVIVFRDVDAGDAALPVALDREPVALDQTLHVVRDRRLRDAVAPRDVGHGHHHRPRRAVSPVSGLR